MCKRFCFRPPFSSQCVSAPKTLLKSSRHHFHTNFSVFRDKFSWKKLLQVRSEIVGRLFNTLTANDKNSPHNRENFPQKNQMQFGSQRVSACKSLPKSSRHHFCTDFSVFRDKSSWKMLL